jgi:hypothetical protein
LNPLLIIATSIFISGTINAQSFEGTLNYKAEYKFEVSPEMQKMGITKEMLIEKMKKEGTWSDSIRVTYKQNNYITYSSFSPAVWTIYKGNTNKLYTFHQDDPSLCTVTDASMDLEENMTGNKPVIGKSGTVVEINGWMCDEVHVVWKSGTYDYYYHQSTFTVDTALYSKHIYDGFAGFIKISHSLPVRIVKTIKGLATVTLTLSSYNNDKVDDSEFDIPELVYDRDLNIIKLPNREVMRIKK